MLDTLSVDQEMTAARLPYRPFLYHLRRRIFDRWIPWVRNG